MPELLHPGVYVLEVPSLAKPIQGVSTSTAGFVGVADRGPVPGYPMPFGPPAQPPLVTSFTQYGRLFGSYRQDSYLTYAVQNFFDNGGQRVYIVRVVDFAPPAESGYAATGARLAAAGLVDSGNLPTLGVVASSPGGWANDLSVSVQPASSGAPLFKLVVSEAGAQVESFDNLSMDPQSDGFVDATVNSSSLYIRIKSSIPTGATPASAAPAPDPVLRLTGDDGRPSLHVSSPTYLAGPLTITVERTDPTFRMTVLQGSQTLESYEGLTMDSSQGSYAVTRINARSRYVSVSYVDTSPPTFDILKSRPSTASTTFDAPVLPAAAAYPAGAGSDGAEIGEGDQAYVGRADLGTGLHAFDPVTDVNIIAIPGQGNDLVVSAGMAYCKNRPLQDAFFIADLGTLSAANEARIPGAAPIPSGKDSAIGFVRNLSTPNDYGAIYYPWITAADPIGLGRNPTILLPPSGYMAGLYARTDSSRGVFKAPAGTEAGLAGALGLSDSVSDADQDSMNPIGLNAVRRFPVYGIVCWGTRTLSADPAWRYLSVRRVAIFLRASIYNGIQWAVFEPNDQSLWAALRLNIRAFMLTQFRAGAFQGATPADAFFVECGPSTTTQQDIDNGVVNILVGFAPLKPAEFVVLQLSQKVNLPAA